MATISDLTAELGQDRLTQLDPLGMGALPWVTPQIDDSSVVREVSVDNLREALARRQRSPSAAGVAARANLDRLARQSLATARGGSPLTAAAAVQRLIPAQQQTNQGLIRAALAEQARNAALRDRVQGAEARDAFNRARREEDLKRQLYKFNKGLDTSNEDFAQRMAVYGMEGAKAWGAMKPKRDPRQNPDGSWDL
jgi:hypothetical protein